MSTYHGMAFRRLGGGAVVLTCAMLAQRCGGDDATVGPTAGAGGSTSSSATGTTGQGGTSGATGSTATSTASTTGNTSAATGGATTAGSGGAGTSSGSGGNAGTTSGSVGSGGSGTAGVGGASGGVGGARDGGGGAAGSAGAGGARDAGAETGTPPADGSIAGAIQYVFVVVEENHDWSTVKNLPYLSHLLQLGARSEQYYNPKGLHPSEPNYVWLEAGNNHGITSDADPSTNHLVKNSAHLAKLLDAKGISWMSYQEGIAAGTCPIASTGKYAAKHDPFIFFDDVVGDPPSAKNPYCIQHHKPFTQFLPDLKSGAVAHYNFITPNLDDDMHDGTAQQADDWLKANIDPIVNPANPNHNPAIYARAVVILTWDEGALSVSDGPIGLVVLSPYAKVGFSDTTTPTPYYYTHSSTLLTVQKLLGVDATPLGDAANARDFSALFTKFPP